MLWSNNSQDSAGARAMQVRACSGFRMGIFDVFHTLWDPYWALAGPTRVPYGTLPDPWGNWHNQDSQKSHTGVKYSRTGPIVPLTAPSRAVHRQCTISKSVRGARKLIMYALKLYEPRAGKQNRIAPHGYRTGPGVDVGFLFKTACVRGPGVWCDRGIS